MIALLLIVCVPRASAMSEGFFVTKDTQAEMGLHFSLSAVRVSDTAVLVRMEIPKEVEDSEASENVRWVGKSRGVGGPSDVAR